MRPDLPRTSTAASGFSPRLFGSLQPSDVQEALHAPTIGDTESFGQLLRFDLLLHQEILALT